MRVNQILDSPDGDENKEIKTKFEFSVSNFESNSKLVDEFDLDSKTISHIERNVRNSTEYRKYITYLKEELDLTKCSILESIDIKEFKVSLEFHHYPINLYEICEIIAKKKIAESQNGASLFEISEEVVKEHFLNEIGLVPLTKTIHKMAHSDSITIPTKKVNGNYRAFMKKYSEFIDPDLTEKVLQRELLSNMKEINDQNKTKLEKNISYYDITYNENDTEKKEA